MAVLCTVLLLVLLPSLASACSVVPGGCSKATCQGYYKGEGKSKVLLPKSDSRVGFYYGIWNTLYTPQSQYQSKLGGPALNYEVFLNVESKYLMDVSAAKQINSLPACCYLCSQTLGCVLYQYFENANPYKITTGFNKKATIAPGGAYVAGQQCYLLTGGSYNTPDFSEGPYGAPPSGTHTEQTSEPNKEYPPSYVGGICNPAGHSKGEPHFAGADGTRFDFNGEVDRTFVLVSDAGLNINVKLGGFLTSNRVLAAGGGRMKNGSAILTWMEEVGITWTAEGRRHTAALYAREGEEIARSAGFLARLVIDGQDVPVPEVGGVVTAPGFEFQFEKVRANKRFEMETYSLKLGGKLEAKIEMMPAEPWLRTEEDAHVHFDIHVTSFVPTERVHGILGQTFRQTQAQMWRALQFRALTQLLRQRIHADGESGKGLLDGEVEDYKTSSLLAEDSKYSFALQ